MIDIMKIPLNLKTKEINLDLEGWNFNIRNNSLTDSFNFNAKLITRENPSSPVNLKLKNLTIKLNGKDEVVNINSEGEVIESTPTDSPERNWDAWLWGTKKAGDAWASFGDQVVDAAKDSWEDFLKTFATPFGYGGDGSWGDGEAAIAFWQKEAQNIVNLWKDAAKSNRAFLDRQIGDPRSLNIKSKFTTTRDTLKYCYLTDPKNSHSGSGTMWLGEPLESYNESIQQDFRFDHSTTFKISDSTGKLIGFEDTHLITLHDVLTASMFEPFNYFMYFTDLDNNPFTDFELDDNYKYEKKDINWFYLFFIDKIKVNALDMGGLLSIPYGFYNVTSYLPQRASTEKTVEYNVLNDEILTFKRFVERSDLGLPETIDHQASFNMHIICRGEYKLNEIVGEENNLSPYKGKLESANAWHFTLEDCKFVDVDGVKFTNEKIQPTVLKAKMTYKNCWLKDETVSTDVKYN